MSDDLGRAVPPHASGPGSAGIAPPVLEPATASREYFAQCLAIYRAEGFAEDEAAWRACEHYAAALPTPIPLPDELREMRERLGIDDDDNFVASGEDLEWLAKQLVAWPHRRIDPERTMNDRFLRQSAAMTLLTLTATKPSGQVERVTNGQHFEADDFGPIGDAARRICSWVDATNHHQRKAVYDAAKRELAALSTQVQTVGGEIEPAPAAKPGLD